MTAVSNLVLLRELTHQLTLQDVVRTKRADWVRYDVTRGNCLGLGLLHERTVAVQKAFMSAGTVFPPHVHGEIEILVIFEGRLRFDGVEYGPADIIRFAESQEHSIEALEDTWMIAVTIPASSAYPDVEARGNGKT